MKTKKIGFLEVLICAALIAIVAYNAVIFANCDGDVVRGTFSFVCLK